MFSDTTRGSVVFQLVLAYRAVRVIPFMAVGAWCIYVVETASYAIRKHVVFG